jgi:hypothetical protein
LKRYVFARLRAALAVVARGGSVSFTRAKSHTACVTAPDISRSDFSALPLRVGLQLPKHRIGCERVHRARGRLSRDRVDVVARLVVARVILLAR